MRTFHQATKITKELEKDGHSAYVVGGAVRELLTKQNAATDIDLATSAKPEQVKRTLKKLGLRFFVIGEKFGTIAALTKQGNIEITTYRKEGKYSDKRHPDKVSFNATVKEDSNRRDFTIGSIYYNLVSKEILDFHKGIPDLKNKTIRFVNNPNKRIQEDPLRILRAARFATTLSFKIAPKDFKAIKENAKLIKKVSAERIKHELDLIMLSENCGQGIELLSHLQILKYILPELEDLKKVLQSRDFHNEGNAFIHSLLTLKKMSEQGSGKEFLPLRYAALLHDIGKKGTAKKGSKNGRAHISFHGHAHKGAAVFSKIAKRLSFPSADTKRIHYLINHHMDILKAETLSDKALKKLRKSIYFKDLIYLRLADSGASLMTDTKGKFVPRNLEPLRKLLRLSAVVKIVQKKKLVSGNDVMRILKIKQGEKVGKVLEKVFDLQMKGKIKTKKDAIKVLKSLDKFH